MGRSVTGDIHGTARRVGWVPVTRIDGLCHVIGRGTVAANEFGVGSMIDPDGFRPNVGIVLLHASGQVFWARRLQRDGWQFPQGGMNSDETPLEAMYRELHEETGRSEERRGGKECVRTGRFRGAPYHKKKKK